MNDNTHDLDQRGADENYDLMVQAQVPEKTDTYTPIPHKEIDDHVKKTIQSHGLQLLESEYKLNNDAKVALAMYTIRKGEEDRTMDYRVAWRNSYDKSRALTIVSGIHVRICSNTSIWGNDMNLSKKHTGTLDSEFHDMLELQIFRMGQKLSEGEALRDKWSQEQLTRNQWAAILGQMMYRYKAITPGMVPDLNKDVHDGPFAVDRDAGFSTNRWNLYMNVTHALKEVHPAKFFDLQRKAYEAFHMVKAPTFSVN